MGALHSWGCIDSVGIEIGGWGVLRVFRYLTLAFIEIERSVQLRLPGKQFLELAFLLEGTA
jgi:hypothetical protein